MLVEMREVLKVRYLTRTPKLCERCDVPVLQQVGQIGGQDVVVDIIAELQAQKYKLLSTTGVRSEKRNMGEKKR